MQQRFSLALANYASLLESLNSTREILYETAQALGEFYHADHVCLIYPSREGNAYQFKCLWHDENSISQCAFSQLTQIEKYAFIQDLFYTNDIIHIPDTEMLRPATPRKPCFWNIIDPGNTWIFLFRKASRKCLPDSVQPAHQPQ